MGRSSRLNDDLWVFFSYGHKPRWSVSWWARFLTATPFAHCVVSHDGVVLDPSLKGNRFWPVIQYVLRHPGLTHGYRVPASADPKLDDFEGVEYDAPPVVPTLLRWLTRGFWPANDCVATTTTCLRRAGVSVPTWIVTPRQLSDWLWHRGYHREELV